MRHPVPLSLAAVVALSTATCGSDPLRVTCADTHTTRVCEGDDCSTVPCRGDELCSADACVPWFNTDLSADFTLTYGSTDPLTVIVQVLPDGFPREFVEHVRFDFGDGYLGWGESVLHRYAAPGVYPVDLEITLSGYRVLRASRLAVVGEVPAEQQPLALTVDRVPEYLNGQLPYHSDNATPADASDDVVSGFHLLLPDHGFTVDLQILDRPQDPIDLSTLRLVADQDIGAAPAGTDLAGHFVFDDGVLRVPRGTWLVGPDDTFPESLVTLTASAESASGVSYERSLTIETAPLPAERQPFDRPMQWLLRFDMDRFTTTGGPTGTGTFSIESTPGADGIADFAAELATFGAQSEDDAPGAKNVAARGVIGASAIYLSWVKHAVLREVYRVYRMTPAAEPKEGIAFNVFADGDAGAPDPTSFSESGAFSMMRMGGVLADGFLGRSYFGVYNEQRIDDTESDLGVGTASILNALVATPGLSEEFDPIKPEVGVPVGEDAQDAVVLSDHFDRYDPKNTAAQNARYDTLAKIARFLGIAIANVTAHEMGHAMGLMPNGPPPDGYFGGRTDVTFMGPNTNSHHADFPGLNLMQAGGSLLSVLASALSQIEHPPGYELVDIALGFAYENRLSPYELAYIQGRLTYRDFDGPVAPGYVYECR